jgi:hypothetical protein
MTTPLTRSQAKRWTIGAQAGALICVLGAVGVGVIGLPEHSPGAVLEQARANAWPINTPKAGGAEPDDVSDARGRSGIDTLGLAQRFALMDNAPVPQVAVEPDPDETPPVVDPVPDDSNITILRRVRYIGFINDARTQHAFIRIDGKQRIVSTGGIAKSGDEQFPDLRVERITPNLIILSDGETRAGVNLAETRSGPSITMVSGDEVAVAPAASENGSLLTAEEEAQIAALPVRQQQMARRRLEREKRGLPPENSNRRPTPEPLVTVRGSMDPNAETPSRRTRDRSRDE